MLNPNNQAAQLIISAQSVIKDLVVQLTEIQGAITKQQTLIDSLAPVAEWTEQEDPSVGGEDNLEEG